jgi:hypothetical protein
MIETWECDWIVSPGLREDSAAHWTLTDLWRGSAVDAGYVVLGPPRLRFEERMDFEWTGDGKALSLQPVVLATMDGPVARRGSDGL